jgi:hypothetical protein
MPQPMDEWMVDRQDPLLALRRRRRHATRLVHQRVLARAEVHIDRGQLSAEIVTEAPNCRSRDPFVRTTPVFAPLNTCSRAKSRRFRTRCK